MAEKDFNRRRFPRVQAPILFRSKRLFGRRAPVIDIGLGGMRVYSDDAFKIGQGLDIELLLPDGDELVCQVRVVWLGMLEPGAPAKYDVGLELLAVEGGQIGKLASALKPALQVA
jgi:hypothetical protein